MTELKLRGLTWITPYGSNIGNMTKKDLAFLLQVVVNQSDGEEIGHKVTLENTKDFFSQIFSSPQQ